VRARRRVFAWAEHLGHRKEGMSALDVVVLVVPCYNEATRLDAAAFTAMVDDIPGLNLLFVDDGSRDGTPEIHQRLCAARPGRVESLTLPRNQGKAEAVRQGLLRALAGPATGVGYLDADLATPPSEVLRLLALFQGRPQFDVLLASRVKLLGRTIDRNAGRHYLGRVFATAASLVLRMPVYDTQCGAKLLRRSPALTHALAEPFRGRWTFDVELLGRLVTGAPGIAPVPLARIHEEPLLLWRDVGESKLNTTQVLQAGLDLALIGRDLARRRRAR
jgi:glycosyltransferase involved in cell wall biosynthesis